MYTVEVISLIRLNWEQGGRGWLNSFFLIVFLKTCWVSETILHLIFISSTYFARRESERQNKRNLCIFFAPDHGVPCPYWYEVHILTRSYEKTSSNFGDYSTKGVSTIPHGFPQFWQHLPSNFEKKNFFPE